ncbi:MAG: WbqC family protein [Arachidicoccus sp.]|nr:WbqC family protein [Arachidicoccus sp.]
MSINNIQQIENHYFPCINWFKTSNEISYISLLSNEAWRKMSFRNRCVIAGSNGLIQLSAPILKGRNQHAIYKDIRLDYSTSWQAIHWKSIISCYKKSPFFEYYADQLNIFFNKKYSFLFDLNEEIIISLNKYLNDLQTVDNIELNIVKIKLEFCEPKNYYQISQPIVYQQLFENKIGFKPNLSILDLLFMEGPNAKRMLSS